MIVKISFNLDTNTLETSGMEITSIEDVSDLDKVISQMKGLTEISEPQKTSKPRKKKDKNEEIIKLEDNKLALTQKLLNLISAEPGDRLCIRFQQFGEYYFPVIAKSEVYADPDAGNKLTKSLTLSYRGKQREDLIIYGEEFTFEETFEGSQVCKLIGKSIRADDEVFKSTADLSPSTDKPNKDKSKSSKLSKKAEDLGNTGFMDNVKFTYTPELPNFKSNVGKEVNINPLSLGGLEDTNPCDWDDLFNKITETDDL